VSYLWPYMSITHGTVQPRTIPPPKIRWWIEFVVSTSIEERERESGVRRKFSCGGVLLSGIWSSFVFGVRCMWRHILTSYSCFQTNVLAKFADTICTFFYIHFPHFMCHHTEYKLLALQVRISEKNALYATTQQFITAKISDCALIQRSKTHSPMRQSNLQLQNETALMSRRIRAVEHRKSGLDWLTHNPVWKIESY